MFGLDGWRFLVGGWEGGIRCGFIEMVYSDRGLSVPCCIKNETSIHFSLLIIAMTTATAYIYSHQHITPTSEALSSSIRDQAASTATTHAQTPRHDAKEEKIEKG